MDRNESKDDRPATTWLSKLVASIIIPVERKKELISIESMLSERTGV